MIKQLTAMPKYAMYKDSGMEWLVEIPKQWTVKRLKYLLDEVNDRSETGQEELLSLSKYKGVVRKSSLEEKAGQAISLVGYKKVANGQLVINKMQAVNGLLAVSSLNGITSPDYSVYKEKNNAQLNIYYLNYLLGQPEFLAEFKKRVTGVMEGFIRLYTDDLYDIKVIMPPFPEQTAIAAFLDRKTAQIDQAVAIKEKQIALLKERKQILIQNAVTRGLNSDVPMRDSCVDWIGEIPVHWKLEKAKWLFNKADRPVFPEDDIVTCFRDGQVTLRTNRRTEGFTYAIQEHGYQGIRKGDLVIHAMDAFAGAIGVSDSDGKSSPVYSACVPRQKNKVNVYFYAYYMRDLALSGFLVSLAKGIRERSTDFRFKDFAELILPLPSLDEQVAIVTYIEIESAKIDRAIALMQQQSDKLKEYKATLINSTVTGKIKVPELVEVAAPELVEGELVEDSVA